MTIYVNPTTGATIEANSFDSQGNPIYGNQLGNFIAGQGIIISFSVNGQSYYDSAHTYGIPETTSAFNSYDAYATSVGLIPYNTTYVNPTPASYNPALNTATVQIPTIFPSKTSSYYASQQQTTGRAGDTPYANINMNTMASYLPILAIAAIAAFVIMKR